ncbi:glycerophosphoryl diester phosphodiesterase membrane domain-containing protein [Cryobacterium aureum]|uniref:glycerophosphoryl diester phosphodiesterase membrane domain-containing protein n=1 Tax=Cryobacterium aureum TaxID=995037 RepID=UPI000CF47EB8|nr:glycerophosphoryl diester phosphodiesterase membrane domain-containing protein [Cryobacterium aureum]
MTDPWQAPDTPVPPRYGEFAAPVSPDQGAPYQNGPYPGGPYPGGAAGQGWAPPPKPGLIPLRPIGFGTLLGASFQVLRRNPKATFGSGLIVQAVIMLVTVVVVGLVTFWAFDRIDSAPLDQKDAVTAGSFLAGALSGIIPIALSLIASALLQAVIVVEVARATLGEKLRLGALWRKAATRLWPLVLWTVLLAVALFIGVAVVIGIVVLLISVGGTAGFVAGVLVGIFGGLLLAAVSAFLYTKTSVVPSLIVLEKLSVRASVVRSWSLTRGYFWRTLGVLLLIGLIVQVITQIISMPVSLLMGIGASLIDPNGALTEQTTYIITALSLIVAIPVAAVAAVVQSAAIALIYLDLRMRKEGLDLELARYVESAAQGGDVPDPYLVPAAPGTGYPAA